MHLRRSVKYLDEPCRADIPFLLPPNDRFAMFRGGLPQILGLALAASLTLCGAPPSIEPDRDRGHELATYGLLQPRPTHHHRDVAIDQFFESEFAGGAKGYISTVVQTPHLPDDSLPIVAGAASGPPRVYTGWRPVGMTFTNGCEITKHYNEVMIWVVGSKVGSVFYGEEGSNTVTESAIMSRTVRLFNSSTCEQMGYAHLGGSETWSMGSELPITIEFQLRGNDTDRVLGEFRYGGLRGDLDSGYCKGSCPEAIDPAFGFNIEQVQDKAGYCCKYLFNV
jgi:hypothetical protein